LPASAKLRRSGSIIWAASEFKMSTAGFEHAFARAVKINLAGGIAIRVAPPIVTALLKIIVLGDD
jgi:predicted nucleotidyltransferase